MRPGIAGPARLQGGRKLILGKPGSQPSTLRSFRGAESPDSTA